MFACAYFTPLEISLMLRLPRKPTPFWSMSLRLPAMVCAASMLLGAGAFGQADSSIPAAPTTTEAPAVAAPPAAAPVAPAIPENEPLKESVDNFWHYGKIARYDIAAAEAQHILSLNTSPLDLLTVFESVAAQHHDNLDEWMLRWQGVDQFDAPSHATHHRPGPGPQCSPIRSKIYRAEHSDAGNQPRGYDLSIDRLRESGELAVPMMIDYLRDPTKSQYHGAIRRALRAGIISGESVVGRHRDAGRANADHHCLGSGRHRLRRGRAISGPAGAVGFGAVERQGHRLRSLHKLRVDDISKLNAADLFYDLGERFYYDNAAVRADKRMPVGYVWYWGESKGLTKIDVPQPIFHDVMSKRSAEYSLKLGQSQSDALSLWLAANYQDEADLPPGEKDPTLPPDAPSAHYFGTASGIRYLNSVLARANKDRNAPVAMKVILSMEDIGGQANLFGGGDHPLMDALRFPDRLVQYEAAFALADALPSEQFSGQEHMVPLLSEALSQTGAASVLVVVQTQDELNGLMDGLSHRRLQRGRRTHTQQAVAAAAARPTIDAILISEDIGPTAIAKLSLLAGQTPRLASAVKVVVTKTKASPYSVQAVNDPMLSTTQVQLTDTAGLKAAIESARQHGGLLPLDADTAAHYATRTADLLAKIAVNRSPVFDLTVTLNLLLSALEDSRPDIVKSDAIVLGLINSPEIQPALLSKASDDKTPDDLKIACPRLWPPIPAILATAPAARLPCCRMSWELPPTSMCAPAAAEAHGALNLPADQAKLLIISQSRTSN